MPVRPKSEDWDVVAQEIGARVRALRLARELTQEKLAHRAGIHRNQVQNIERNRNNTRRADGASGPANPAIDTLYLIATALDVDVTELLPPRRVTPPSPDPG